jgi:hypothetical protein
VWTVGSADGGASFTDPLSVGGGAINGSSRAALGDANLGVVWIAGTGTDRALWFRAVDVAIPAGSPPPLRLSTPGDGASEPDLEAAASAFGVVWSDGAGAVFGASSGNGGASFTQLSRVAKAASVAMPRVAVSGSFTHRVWLDRAGRLVYRRDAADSTAPAVDRTLGRRAVFPDLEVDGGVVCVAWQTKSGRAARLLAALSIDAGTTFGPLVGLSKRDEFAAAPRALAGRGRAAVVWQMPVGGRHDVFFRSVGP